MRQAAMVALVAFVIPVFGTAAEEPAAEPVLKLTSPGRAPLKALRYRAKAGQRGSVTMSMTTSMAMSMGGQAMPAAPTPEIRCVFNYHVTGLTPAGDIRYEFDFGDFEVVPQPSIPAATMEAMRGALAGMSGMRGHAVVSTRGITHEADIQMPANAPPQLRGMTESFRQSVRQLSAPLPEEPVGPGARWETTYRLTQNGITIEQTAHNEVAALDGDRGRLAIKVTQTGAPQPLLNPDMPKGSRADLLSLASTGEGFTEFDLNRLAPTAGSVKLKMLMKMRMQMGEEKPQDMEMTMDMSMSVTGGR